MKLSGISPRTLVIMATLLSGGLSGHFLLPNGTQDPGSSNWGLLYGPGIFFGIAIALACLWLYRRDWQWSLARSLLWVAVSTGAWYLALRIALSESTGTSGFVSYALAGAAGSAILAAAFWALVRHLAFTRLLLTVAAGSVLGIAMNLILMIGLGEWAIIAAFIVWQMGVGLALVKAPPPS
ncbi:MAG TPA: hypothetical protein VLF67_00435 [Candidatus Saccharimonas sp.]|nr:hypothetical protein [Candidatus Saccharimonas sp.]